MKNKENDDNSVSDILTEKERQDVVRRSAPGPSVVYETLRKEAEEELERPTAPLMWSGLAAGLSMGFSFLTEALLLEHLPDISWSALISKLGYSVGFLIVILGRQQLFTENTLPPILQLLNRKNAETLYKVLRLWGIVLVSNVLGALIFAFLMESFKFFDHEIQGTMMEVANKVYQSGPLKTFIGAIFAGWLIALTIWLLPFAETARVTVIIIITYVVGLGGFSHVIAGTVNAFFALCCGTANLENFFLDFFIPTLLGNIVGGVAFVSAINHAQASPEYSAKKRSE